MPAIVTRTLHGASDKVLRLTNCEALRQMEVGIDWTTLCLGVRFRFRTNYNFGVNGVFAAGLCAGTSSGYSGGHMVGYRTKFITVNIYGSGEETHIANYVNNYGYGAVFQKSGQALTDAGEHGYTPWDGHGCRIKMGNADGDATRDYGWLIYFVKRTPNWRVGIMLPAQSQNGGENGISPEHDLTSEKLIQALDTGSIEEALARLNYPYSGGYWFSGEESVAVAGDDLDSVCLHWNKVTNDVEVSEVAAAVWG